MLYIIKFFPTISVYTLKIKRSEILMKSLFDTTELAGMTLKNRFIRSATYDGLSDEKGHITKKTYELYENLAKGGVGTIITGLTFVSDLENTYPGQAGIYDDSFISEYNKLSDMVHSYNTNIIMQLVWNGTQAYADSNSSKTFWGPSSVEDVAYKYMPSEMTEEEIVFVQKAFADAAYRAKKAGFDGVQIHAAHGYLLSKFLTPYYNRRTDQYGGNIENRSRIILETFKVIRDRVGLKYPIFIKINSEDFIEQGMSFDDCKYVCNKLAQMGIDAIEISGGCVSSPPTENVSRPKDQEQYYKKYATEIARENKVPVISVGGNRNIDSMIETINTTDIEYVSLSRALICESDLINRWKEDSTPAKCISCNKCFSRGGTICIFNKGHI